MAEEAKSILNKIRSRSQQSNGGVVGFHPTLGALRVGGRSPFDEMLELYIAARESEDQEKLRAQIGELQEDLASSKKGWSDSLEKLREVLRDRDDIRRRQKSNQKVLYQLLREGDIICICVASSYSSKGDKQRRKIMGVDRETGNVTYVNWDTRQKDWAKTAHTENIELFALGDSRSILQVERPEDKENTKNRKAKAKGK